MKKLLALLLTLITPACFAVSLQLRGLFYDAFVTPDSNTIAFLPFDRSDYTDPTGTEWTLTKDAYSDAAIVSGGKYKKALYDGTGTSPDSWSLTPANLSELAEIGTGGFTFEFWFKSTKLDDNPSSSNYLFRLDAGLTAGTYRIELLSYADSSNIEYWVVNATHAGDNFSSLSQSYVAGAWSHIAFVRSSGACKVYVNGSEIYSINGTAGLATADFSTIQSFTLGRPSAAGSISDWLIDEVRISKTARYTGSFTPSHHGVYQPNKLTLKGSGKLYLRGD